MIKAVFNTKDKGVLNFILYKENNDYVAVCLNFDLVEYGKNPKELQESIQEAALSYLQAVNKRGASDDCLNICPGKKHLEILKNINNALELQSRSKKRSLSSTVIPFTMTLKSYSDKQQFAY